MQANKNSQKTGPVTQNAGPASRSNKRAFWFAVFWIALVMAILFYKSFYSGWVHFSNDGPLGALKAEYQDPRHNFTGVWQDIYWLGVTSGTPGANLNTLIFAALGPIGDSKFLAPLSLFWLGICAWVFFRQLKLSPLLSLVAAFGAALNMNFFSNVCWGLGTRGLTLGWVFLALAVIVNFSRRNGGSRAWLKWLKVLIGGFLVGMAVIEGADNGAIFSLYVGTFVIFLALVEEGVSAKSFSKGISRAVLIAIFAGVVASQTILALVGTQIKGIAGMKQEEQSSEQRWTWATQWSLPKAETLRVIIPGLYGYRMDSPDGKQYWGRVGEGPGLARFSGSGEYAGVLVLLIAAWGLAESFRRDKSAFEPKERKIMWFWSIAAFISLLMAWGHYAPFYKLFYSLPGCSTIRNPIKFMHPFHLSVMILFGYGLLGLSRRYLQGAASKSDGAKSWWATASPFEKRWTYGSFAVIAIAIVGYLSYFSDKAGVEKKVASEVGEELGKMTAAYSVHEVGLFVLMLILSVALLTLVLRGAFAGKRANLGGVLLGLLLLADMTRANKPWIKFYNYDERYASNAVIDILRDKPYEHRVVLPPAAALPPAMPGLRYFGLLQNLYHVEWLQQQFPYYNLQSLDIPQENRMPADKFTYVTAFKDTKTLLRYWQLTNTRYILGTPDMADYFNALTDPEKKPFRIATTFKPILKPTAERLTTVEDLTISTNPQTQGLIPGDFALIDYTGALPRAKLYSNWQTTTNDEAVLKALPSPEFNPEQTVFVDGATPASSSAPNAAPGTVEIVSYATRKVELRTKADTASVLLLNDKYDPGWKVWIDGKPDTLLRANFIMQAAFVPAGAHTVEFRFEPAVNTLYVTMSAIGFSLLLCGVLFVATSKTKEPEPESNSAVSASETK